MSKHSIHLTIWLSLLAGAVSISSAQAAGQEYEALPQAPEPQAAVRQFVLPYGFLPVQQEGSDKESASASAPAIGDESVVTMFPHPEAARWWLSGQANIIFQAHPPFHALYSGPNSLSNAGEYKTSLLGTLRASCRLLSDCAGCNSKSAEWGSLGSRPISSRAAMVHASLLPLLTSW